MRNRGTVKERSREIDTMEDCRIARPAGRTQELLEVYVDSPMALAATRITLNTRPCRGSSTCISPKT
jgi:hypothetical protein